jgi:hypothetical protein
VRPSAAPITALNRCRVGAVSRSPRCCEPTQPVPNSHRTEATGTTTHVGADRLAVVLARRQCAKDAGRRGSKSPARSESNVMIIQIVSFRLDLTAEQVREIGQKRISQWRELHRLLEKYHVRPAQEEAHAGV